MKDGYHYNSEHTIPAQIQGDVTMATDLTCPFPASLPVQLTVSDDDRDPWTFVPVNKRCLVNVQAAYSLTVVTNEFFAQREDLG